MVFNATFNNISVISWRSVLLVEETGVPGENHPPAASHWQAYSHNVVSSTPHLSRIQTYNVSGDRHWLHKSNYHTITITTDPKILLQNYLFMWFITEATNSPYTSCGLWYSSIHDFQVLVKSRLNYETESLQ